jgi:hypothetical protein
MSSCCHDFPPRIAPALIRASRRTLAYTAWSVAPTVAVAAALVWLLGSPALLIAGVLALPWLAWRYDNETGAFFPVAILFLIVCIVLALLLLLMAIAIH